MKITIFHTFLSLTLLLFFQACGSSAKVPDTKKEETSNYLSLAKYHFLKASVELTKNGSIQSKKSKNFRSYPGAKPSDIEDTNKLKITTITPFNKYIEFMSITSKHQTINIEIKNKRYAIISLYKDGVLLKSTKQTMHEFQNFDVATNKGVM